MEIRINRKFLILGAAIVAIVAAALFFVPQLLQPAVAQDEAGGAAERFAQAFFAADYRDKNAWAEGVQSTMTRDGFAVFQAQFLPVVWPMVTTQTIQNNPKDIVTRADPEVALVGTSDLGGTQAEWQIRKVSVVFQNGARWPNVEAPYMLYVVVNRELPNGAWAASATLTEESVAQMQAAQGGTK